MWHMNIPHIQKTLTIIFLSVEKFFEVRALKTTLYIRSYKLIRASLGVPEARVT